ncbi:MAG: TraB/GumN family protein [Saprospiraceae bacterium]
MIKKLLAFTGIALLFSFPTVAQDTLKISSSASDLVSSVLTTKEINPNTPTKAENALLWSISGKDLKDTSYLYGTIHMIDRKDFVMTDHTKAAFKYSEQVAFEIDMNRMNDFSVLFSLLGQVMMKDGMTLDKLLSAEEYKMVEDHFNAMGQLPMFMLKKIKPMFLSTMASGDMMGAGGEMGSSDIVSYEMEFMQMATDQEKEMSGLETIEYQMSVFDSIPYTDQAQMLVESIKAEKGDDSEFDAMVDLYKNEDIVGMQTMFKADEEGIGKFEDIFLKNRNENWIPVMEDLMKQKPTFFAVGAGHLGGDIGVIALLRKEGYKLEPIRGEVVRP